MKTFRNILILVGMTIAGIHLFGQGDGVKMLKTYYKTLPEDTCVRILLQNQEGLKQIVLMRHGEPDLDKKGWRNRNGAEQFMHDYDSVGVKAFDKKPLCTEGLPVDTIFHSTIPRAASTAILAFEDMPLHGDMKFREFERKTMKFCNIKLPLKCWTTGSRLLWFMGMNKKGIESLREAKNRAKNNASFLISQSDEQQLVILVAHGLHNKYVLKYLRKMGWKKVYDQGNGYLSLKVLAMDGDQGIVK